MSETTVRMGGFRCAQHGRNPFPGLARVRARRDDNFPLFIDGMGLNCPCRTLVGRTG